MLIYGTAFSSVLRDALLFWTILLDGLCHETEKITSISTLTINPGSVSRMTIEISGSITNFLVL